MFSGIISNKSNRDRLERRIQCLIICLLVLISSSFYGCKAQKVRIETLGLEESLTLGYQYIEEDNYSELVEISRHIIELDAYCPSGYIGYAAAWMSIRESEKALSVLNSCLKGIGKDYSADVEELVSYIKNGSYTRARGMDIYKRCSDRYLELLNSANEPVESPLAVYPYTDEQGNTCQVFGKLDVFGRMNGFCVVNTFDTTSLELLSITEADFVFGLEEGPVAELSILVDLDENQALNIEIINGFYQGGDLIDGKVEIRDYKSIFRPEYKEGEIIRISDWELTDLFYSYVGFYENGLHEDNTGEAHEIWVDVRTGRTIEYIGQFVEGRHHGYGKMWDDRGWVYEGRFVDDAPVDLKRN